MSGPSKLPRELVCQECGLVKSHFVAGSPLCSKCELLEGKTWRERRRAGPVKRLRRFLGSLFQRGQRKSHGAPLAVIWGVPRAPKKLLGQIEFLVDYDLSKPAKMFYPLVPGQDPELEYWRERERRSRWLLKQSGRKFAKVVIDALENG